MFGELLRTNNTEGIEVEALLTAGGALTDTNRNKCVDAFLKESEADAIAWIDDDTIPAPKAFIRLVQMIDTDVANQVYYLRGSPYNPVCYRRMPNRKYLSLKSFQPGQIVEVDSVGMGCTLVWRRVYEAIVENYDVYMRTRIASPFAVHKDDVTEVQDLPYVVHNSAGGIVRAPTGVRGYLVDPVVGPLDEGDYERFPFYLLEAGRTEDHYFCEMVKRLGFTIKTDTWNECQHLGVTAYDGSQYREVMRKIGSYLTLRGMMGYADPRSGAPGSRQAVAGQRDNESREPARVEGTL